MSSCQISSKSFKRLKRYGDLTDFAKWRPSAILDLVGAYWDHPQWPRLFESSTRTRARCAFCGRRVWPVGEFPKKSISKKIRCILPIYPEAPWADLHQIWHSRRGRRADLITCTQFLGDWLRGMDSVVVENCHLPLTRLVAVNTGLALLRNPWSFCLNCQKSHSKTVLLAK